MIESAASTAQPARGAPRMAASLTGKQVAVVGGGPAGLACAARLALLGNSVLVFEARSSQRMQEQPPLPDGDETLAQLERMIALGRIRIEHGRKLGQNLDLSELHLCHDAVFLGVGLAAGRVLGVSGAEPPGLLDAGKRVAAVHCLEDLLALPVPHRAIVLGAARSAIDMAVRLKRLGAQDVTLALRHGVEADGYVEQTARAHFVRIRPWASPLEVLRDERGGVQAVRFEQTRVVDGRLTHTGGFTEIAAHAVFKAVGRAAPEQCERDEQVARISREGERVRVDDCLRTALPGIYAGGDCVAPGQDTALALRHGVLAAQAIHADLQS
ncbi:hypothetical protein B0920_13015 [Massilia sp. KIM]|nr:hypothetical protein B0920_13015 [Massilia sp. KIM]